MQMTNIALKVGKSAEYKSTLMRETLNAMHETFAIPQNDCFMRVTEHRDEEFSYGRDYMNINRSDDLVIIEIKAGRSHTSEQKQALYATICERLTQNLKMRPEDIFINIVEVAAENWSFGHGKAQMAWDCEPPRTGITNTLDKMIKSGRLSVWL